MPDNTAAYGASRTIVKLDPRGITPDFRTRQMDQILEDFQDECRYAVHFDEENAEIAYMDGVPAPRKVTTYDKSIQEFLSNPDIPPSRWPEVGRDPINHESWEGYASRIRHATAEGRTAQ